MMAWAATEWTSQLILLNAILFLPITRSFAVAQLLQSIISDQTTIDRFSNPHPITDSKSSADISTVEVSTVSKKYQSYHAGPIAVKGLITPPMGFNSDETAIKRTADTFIATGMSAAGYKYINLDDCWMADRLPTGEIRADPVRFPSGMKALSDYVHAKGLKFGLYTSASSLTCQHHPGAYGHELQDAATYCSWGVDYLKIDHCGGESHRNRSTTWQLFRQGFDDCYKQTKHYIAIAASSCGSMKDPCHWYTPTVADVWRTTADIQANWASVVKNLDINNQMASISKRGHYNDPDMLQVGNVGLSLTEQRSHFSMWCLVMAPLLSGNDITHMSNETVAILTAPEVIAINQDPMGKQGIRISTANSTGVEVWCRPLADESMAVALLNRGLKQETITVTWKEIGFLQDVQATVRDVWERKDLTEATGSFSAMVDPHDVFLFRAIPHDNT